MVILSTFRVLQARVAPCAEQTAKVPFRSVSVHSNWLMRRSAGFLARDSLQHICPGTELIILRSERDAKV